MAVAVFTPPCGPSTSGTSSASEARVLTAQLGDGYQQITSDGINTIRETLTLNWDGLPKADMQTLDNFMASQLGYLAFQYTAPGAAVPKLWRCAKWGKTPTGPASWSFQATLIQSFDVTTLT
jgi:phage-related protein